MSNAKQPSQSDGDERVTALVSNANAVGAVAAAVEGTLGPKGLDCMLVDRYGDVTITNDGSTILDRIDANHPAARMLIKTAKAQEEEVGDGTTTATLLAAALVAEGVNQANRGVPIAKIIEGISAGIDRASEVLHEHSRPIAGLDDPLLRQAALIAGRGHADLADLAVEAARTVGRKAFDDRAFRLADCVVAAEGADNEVFVGLIIDKSPMNKQMPKELRAVKVLVVDDALEPEQIEDDALATEAGFAKYMELKEEFRAAIRAIIELGVKFVVTDKAVDDEAEEMLTDAGAMVIRRVSSRDMARIVDHTGARTIKRGGLKKSAEELKRALGRARRVTYDERLEHIRIIGGRGRPMATILVGAATEEVKAERERIAYDAASAVQQALLGGVVAGGGAAELAAVSEVERLRDGIKGMAAYGVDCVVAALKRPMTQIVANAGFNPLEKVEDAVAASVDGAISHAIDCDSGEVADMFDSGIVDPAPVKTYALRAAGEVAEAILRINTIIRKRDQTGAGPVAAAGETTEAQPK